MLFSGTLNVKKKVEADGITDGAGGSSNLELTTPGCRPRLPRANEFHKVWPTPHAAARSSESRHDCIKFANRGAVARNACIGSARPKALGFRGAWTFQPLTPKALLIPA